VGVDQKELPGFSVSLSSSPTLAWPGLSCPVLSTHMHLEGLEGHAKCCTDDADGTYVLLAKEWQQKDSMTKK